MPPYDPLAKLKEKQGQKIPACATDYDPLAKVQAKALSAWTAAATHKEPEEEILPDREMENVEVDDKAEADRRPRSALKKSDQAVKDVSGELFHTTIVFLTEAQLKAFMQATGWVSVEHGRYVDGVILAERLGIKLPPARISSIRPGQTEKRANDIGLIDGYPT